MAFIDSHCHLTDERVWKDAELWIKRAEGAGVSQLRIGGLYPEEWARQSALKKRYPKIISTSFGVHPWWVERFNRNELEAALKLLEAQINESHAVGETGLDFYEKRDQTKFADQEFAFRAQIRLAKKYQKALVLHVVKAHEVARRVIQEEGAIDQKMQIHSFSGSAEMAREWLKWPGVCLSFSGGFLRENANRARAALKGVPLDRLLFETDSPDQAWRADGLNEPSFVVEVYQKAAEVLDMKLSSLQTIVAENFARFE